MNNTSPQEHHNGDCSLQFTTRYNNSYNCYSRLSFCLCAYKQ